MKKTILMAAATVLLASNVYAEAPDNGDSLSAAFWANSVTHQGSSVQSQQSTSVDSHSIGFFQTKLES